VETSTYGIISSITRPNSHTFIQVCYKYFPVTDNSGSGSLNDGCDSCFNKICINGYIKSDLFKKIYLSDRSVKGFLIAVISFIFYP